MNHAPLNRPSLDPRLAGLGDSAAVLHHLQSAGAFAAYAGADAPVETIETHMSWVFLVGEHVLKLKKPVRFPSLDFSTIEAREAFCREEVRLNSRLAPGVYRGLMAVQWRAGELAVVPEALVSAEGLVADWLVWMRRLPRARMLDRRMAESLVLPTEIDALVAVLAGFYRSATRIELDPAEHLARFQREQAVSRELLLRPQFQLAGATLALDRLDRALLRSRRRLQTRISQGRIVDGHGDLRPEHVCLLQPPVVIDCLEFSPQLRQVDPVDELSFLSLECDMAGAAWIGDRLLQGCAAALGDAPPPALQPLYTAYRAVVRARLAIAHLLDPCPRTPQKWTPLAQRYITHALLALDAFERLDSVSAATPDGNP
jgi:aminoglycoside phosphotransferase family enzyme